ncbi:MAG: GTA-gp10 family protein [Pseudomonadota bacterium]
MFSGALVAAEMTQSEKSVPVRLGNKVYIVNLDFSLMREIENELGSASALLDRFTQKSWKICELVTITHMMLQAAGETVDYLSLGNLMLKEGLGHYLSSAQSFLRLSVHME